ncbi:hypothetical protein BDB00DRAFT_935599 [Zychaea mexicana]|uniref:uncharacterized protein n=1 Tax=Zychaea mexicana TaxID=64656 RepID=UPI0022FDDB18|nr:uncharacterized protein BDB00DRAFT_935599 [Zychaea mexicana]KAI9498403.1 hypothetical protein BDB00DRAFT_935599 [Zychaea mexicana]
MLDIEYFQDQEDEEVVKSGYLSSVAFSLLFPLSPCFSISRSRNRHKGALANHRSTNFLYVSVVFLGTFAGSTPGLTQRWALRRGLLFILGEHCRIGPAQKSSITFSGYPERSGPALDDTSVSVIAWTRRTLRSMVCLSDSLEITLEELRE